MFILVQDIQLDLHVAEMRKLCVQFSVDTVVLALLQSQRFGKKAAKGGPAVRGEVNLVTSQSSWNKRILLHKDFRSLPQFEDLVIQINNDADPPGPQLQSDIDRILEWRKSFTHSLQRYIHKWLRGAILSLYCAFVVACTQFSLDDAPDVLQELQCLTDSEVFVYKKLLTDKGGVVKGLTQLHFPELELLLKYAAVFHSNDPRNSLDLSKIPSEEDLPSKLDALLCLRSLFQPRSYTTSDSRRRFPPNHFSNTQSSRSTSKSNKAKAQKAEKMVKNPYNFKQTAVHHSTAPALEASTVSSSGAPTPLSPSSSPPPLSPDVSMDDLLAFKLQLLDATECTKASDALSMSGPGVVQDLFGITMRYNTVHCLAGKQWLNDEVLNFMGNLLMVRDSALCSQEIGRKRTLIMNTHFMSTLYKNGAYNFESVSRWTKKQNIFDCRRILIPINTGQWHWHLAVVDMLEKCLLFYDSLASKPRELPPYLHVTLKWLEGLWQEKKKTDPEMGDFPVKAWSMRAATCPKQHNGYDCGVYVLAFMDFLADGLPLTDIKPEFIIHYRLKICSYIRNGVIADPRIDTITSVSFRTKSLPAAKETASEFWSESMDGSSICLELVDGDPVNAAERGSSSSRPKSIPDETRSSSEGATDAEKERVEMADA